MGRPGEDRAAFIKDEVSSSYPRTIHEGICKPPLGPHWRLQVCKEKSKPPRDLCLNPLLTGHVTSHRPFPVSELQYLLENGKNTNTY